MLVRFSSKRSQQVKYSEAWLYKYTGLAQDGDVLRKTLEAEVFVRLICLE
jgi:hypothetical protein